MMSDDQLIQMIRDEGALVWATAERENDLRAAFLAGRMAQKVDDLTSFWTLQFWYQWNADEIGWVINDYQA